MLARLSLSLSLLLVFPVPLMAQPNAHALEVSVKRVDAGEQHVFEVSANGVVKASPEAVWKILTDYERMSEFVPDMQKSRVLARNGNNVVVEQLGQARFLFFRRSIQLVVQISEQPPALIDIGLVTGDMKVYSCRWELVPVPETGGTRIIYSGRLAPRFYVPGMFGSNILRADIERMMTAVLARLDRPD